MRKRITEIHVYMDKGLPVQRVTTTRLETDEEEASRLEREKWDKTIQNLTKSESALFWYLSDMVYDLNASSKSADKLILKYAKKIAKNIIWK